MEFRVQKSCLQGSIHCPPSKSHSLRAILFATLAHGKSKIRNILNSPDTDAMIIACKALGSKITNYPDYLEIEGVAGKPSVPKQVIDAGNSGQVLRFIGAVASLLSSPVEITGDHSIISQRVVTPLLSGLQQLNCKAFSKLNNGFAPIVIKGPLNGSYACIDGQDSQPVSGLLIASAFASQPITIVVNNPGETPWVELTLEWFRFLGIPFENDNYQRYCLKGNAHYSGFDYTVPGDFSSAAFPFLASWVTQSPLKIKGLNWGDIQGDKKVFDVVEQMGACFDKKDGLDIIEFTSLAGLEINVNPFIDAVPFLAVLACFAKTPTLIYGAEIAKNKESNRLAVMCSELKKMGANIEETSDGLKIHPSILKGTQVQSHHDHRVAMALTIAGLAADGETCVTEVDCIAKSYPNFLKDFQAIGAKIDG